MDFSVMIAEMSCGDWRRCTPGLGRIRELLGMLGEPQRRLCSIHIAGTNGKGSIAAMFASVLSAAGLRTGLFTSPYVQRFHERIRVDGTLIDDDSLMRLLSKIQSVVYTMQERPTEFEIYTALAMLYFTDMHCDVAVMETGMGGRLDSTNILENPTLCVIANIGLDHTQIIGDTLEKIAAEKAGIIKEKSTVVLYPQKPSVEAVIAIEAEKCHARLVQADVSFSLEKNDLHGQRFSWRQYQGLEIVLLGDHQLYNAATVLTGLEELRAQGWLISEAAIRKGLGNTRWPARMEVLRMHPPFLLDGGHNPQCIETLIRNIKIYCAEGKRVFLMGMMADKDYPRMCALSAEAADGFVTVTPQNPRALSASALADCLRPYGKPVYSAKSVEEGISLAEAMAGKQGAVFVFGSLYMAGDIRRCFGRE